MNDRKLTLKQRKWIKKYIETGNATEAAMQVYDCKNREVAESIGSENLGKLAFRDLMDEMGLTDITLLNVGAEGMTKPVKQSITGETFPDYSVRHKYWETMLRLKGLTKETSEVNVDARILVIPSELASKYGVALDNGTTQFAENSSQG